MVVVRVRGVLRAQGYGEYAGGRLVVGAWARRPKRACQHETGGGRWLMEVGVTLEVIRARVRGCYGVREDGWGLGHAGGG